MSEAQAAAPVIENGAPPTQEIIDEEPGFKASIRIPPFRSCLSFDLYRSLSEISRTLPRKKG